MSETVRNVCNCGKPVHPLYNGKCEDCWAENQWTLNSQGEKTSYVCDVFSVFAPDFKDKTGRQQVGSGIGKFRKYMKPDNES